ncbi:Allergen Asp f 13 [Ceratocystis lukuohia]|uniref:Allergen Asp f 13 n=1 Tax=Ceratocystis lukuohia TaxID=2019550 RepID=A0ABR4MTS4_9PEZI
MVSFKNLALLLAATLTVGEVNPSSQKYIVTLKPNISKRDLDAHLSWARGVHARTNASPDLSGVTKTFQLGSFTAYLGSFDGSALDEIRSSADVDNIEEDSEWQLHAALPIAAPLVVPLEAHRHSSVKDSSAVGSLPFKRNDQGSPWRLSDGDGTVVDSTDSEITQDTTGTSTQHKAPWGLAALSNKASGGTDYIFPSNGGINTYAYVVDTGVNGAHEDFEGRVELGYSVSGDDGADEIGHGTHVAAIIAGRQSGVAKEARIVSVKAFVGGTSSLSKLIEAYVWAVSDIETKNRTAISVINLSVGGNFSATFNALVNEAYTKGIVNVVSAGNSDDDVSKYSPASSTSAITVGAINPKWGTWMESNYGSLVDVWAPGVDVVSADYASTTGYRSMNGTSMAAPHVAGLVLNLRSHSNLITPAEITSAIINMALKGAIRPFAEEDGSNCLVSSDMFYSNSSSTSPPSSTTSSAPLSTGTGSYAPHRTGSYSAASGGGKSSSCSS